MPTPGRLKHASTSKGSTEIATRLRNIELLEMESGTMKRLGDYWEGNHQSSTSSSSSTSHQDPTQLRLRPSTSPVILIFLRRWGCGVCRMIAANWSILKPTFDDLGIRMVGIGLEKTGYDDFVAGGYFNGELLVDETKASYHALGCSETTWRSLWGFLDGGDIPRMSMLSQKKGFVNNFQGDLNQLGGTFAIAPGGGLLYGHYQTSTNFEVNMPILFNNLSVSAPEDYDPLWATQAWTTKQSKVNSTRTPKGSEGKGGGGFSPLRIVAPIDECPINLVDIQPPPTPARRLGQKLGFVSHVRSEGLTKIVAKLTSHDQHVPHHVVLREVLAHSQLDNPCSPLTLAERNALLAAEIGKRLKTSCFEQGLKALYLAHMFMTKGHVSFREAVSLYPSLLNLDKSGDSMWLTSNKAQNFQRFMKKYGSYLDDLSEFFAVAAPFDLHAKATITKTTTMQQPSEKEEEAAPATAGGGGSPDPTLVLSEEKTITTSTPSPHSLKNAITTLNTTDLQGLLSSAISLFKSAYALTPDEAIASSEVSREMVKLVFSDIKLLFIFLTDAFVSFFFSGRSSSKMRKEAPRGRVRVSDLERWVYLYDQYETACAEVSIFFATAASFNIIAATPKLKPVPRRALRKVVSLLAKSKESGLDTVQWEEEGEEKLVVEVDSLANVLALEKKQKRGAEPDSTPTAMENDLDFGLNIAITTTSGGGKPSPVAQSAVSTKGLDSEPDFGLELNAKPAADGGRSDFIGREPSATNWEDDSLADLRATGYGTAVSSGGNESRFGGSNESLGEDGEDIRALLDNDAKDPAIMVAASENSASAARRFYKLKQPEVLGKGGFGTVYKTWDKQEGMYAAVKEMVVDTKKTTLQELFAEFTTATTVDHENCVRTLMFSLTESTGSIFMEWLPSGSLHHVLSQTGFPFGEHLIRRYIRDALSGLDYLHKRNIVHRDIKISNMLLSVGGRVKLTDFGSSLKMINTTMKTETVVGTVPYMSPEAVRGTYSTASDIWAIGCSIVEMLTTRHPWAERGEKDHIAMIFHLGSLQPPKHMPQFEGSESEISDELRGFVEMCFVFDYRERPSAETLLQHPWLQMDEDPSRRKV